MIKVEVCINSDSKQSVSNSVSEAYHGGAATIELCSSMQFDGLTPKREHIIEARNSFKGIAGLMVMIRQRKGDFYYSGKEIQEMQKQIMIAGDAGADGIVLGVLRENDNCVANNSLRKLMETCRKYNLKSTFHRAFDATPFPLETLELLIDHGIDKM